MVAVAIVAPDGAESAAWMISNGIMPASIAATRYFNVGHGLSWCIAACYYPV